MPADPDARRRDDERLVGEAVAAFYRAFEAMDLPAMAAVWARREADLCVHPGWDILDGWLAIRESWRAIFAHTAFLRLRVHDLRIEILGDVARATCVEDVFTVAGTQTAHSQVAATKLLLRTEGGWRITLHHGSALASHPSVREPDPGEPDN